MINTDILKNALIGIEWEPQLTVLEHPNKIVQLIKKDNLDFWIYASSNRVMTVKGDPWILVWTCHNQHNSNYSVFISVDDAYIPSYYGGVEFPYLIIDSAVLNMEIRTRPVKLDVLKDHIEFCTHYASHFIEDLSKYANGVGMFLPTAKSKVDGHTQPSKHVNISWPTQPGYLHQFAEYNNQLWKWLFNDLRELGYYDLRHYRAHVNVKKSDIRGSAMPSDLKRLHITVPYNFDDYRTLRRMAYRIWTEPDEEQFREHIYALFTYIDSWYSMNTQKDPILICHTSGKKVKILNNLV